MNSIFLIIEGDTNDGDYTMRVNEISEECLSDFLPIISQIKEFKGKYNWPNSFYAPGCPLDLYNIDEELYEEFSYCVPSCENGIHTITEISIIRGNYEKLL